uniref:NADH dehydrogenase [ubiquinone] 1 alpha subcomplex subunit 5 n=1 Tax=Latimeria chalumnae TaxID=7897 RepID=M3XGM9_LATCH
MMAGVLKKTTGLVGLAVAQQPHEHLRILYTKIIAALQTIPRDAAYRKYTEQIVNERMDLVNKVRILDSLLSGKTLKHYRLRN